MTRIKTLALAGGNRLIHARLRELHNELGRRDPELAAAVKEIGRNVTGVQGDVSNLGDLDRLFLQIKREKGKLDIVFTNAGIGSLPRSARSPRSSMTRSSTSM